MNDPMQALRDRFVERCRGDLLRLKALAGGSLLATELQDLAHSLAGAAGVFGYPAVSEAAGRLDDCYSQGAEPAREDLNALIAEVQRAVDADPTHPET